MIRFACFVLGLTLLTACETRIRIPDDALVIRNGTVVDGTGAPPLPDGVVVIVGERILAVGPAGDFGIPSSASVVDAGGGFIIPGIVNAHVHHVGPTQLRREFLLEGVTSVCDMGSPPEELPGFADTEWEGEPVARGFRAGPIVTAPGGYPDGLYGTHINFEVAGPEEARTGIAELAGRGVDVIKIAVDPSWNFADPIPTLGLETVRAIVDEAHRHGLQVRTHLIQPAQMDLAIEAGVDVIEHLAMPRWPSREDENAVMAGADPVGLFFARWAPDYQPRLERMAEAGIAMVPTLSAVIGGFYTEENPTPRQSWVARVVMDIPRRFHDLGGVIAVGNDFNNIAGKEKLPLLEVEMLLEAGFPPMDVLVAALQELDAVVRGGEVVRVSSEVLSIGDDLEVQRLAEGVWRHSSYQELEDFGRSGANGLVVVSDGEAVLVDTPWTDAQTGALFDWVEEELGARITTVIPTHAHPDNLGGLAEAHRRGATSLAYEGTVAAARNGNTEVPRLSVADGHELTVGSLHLELDHAGAGHTRDNTVVWIPERRVLFGGCLVRSASSRMLGYTDEADLEAWPTTITLLRERYEAEDPLIVPGHGSPGGIELLERTLELLGGG